MKNRRRKVTLIGLVLAAVGLATWLALHPSEPEYQGKPLSWWLEQTDGWLGIQTPPTRLLTEAEVESQKQKVTKALVGMGNEGLRHIVQRLAAPKEISPVQKAFIWINENQSFVRIPVKSSPPWSTFASEAIRLLGSNATPILPELSELLQKDTTASLAAECLVAIGPASVPALTHGLTNKSERVRSVSLLSLGNLGDSAINAVPKIAEIAGSNDRLSGIAMRVLSHVDTNAIRFVPLFTKRYWDPNTALDAAFALGQVGEAGIQVLLQGLTNNEKFSSIGALAALQPDLVDFGKDRRSDPSEFSFSHTSARFNVKSLAAAAQMYGRETPPPHLIVPALAHCLRFAEPDLRLNLTRFAADYGIQGIPVLSLASNDDDTNVKREATRAIEMLGLKTRAGGILRGSVRRKQLALIFSAHEFSEGGDTILAQLAAHHAKGSFFLTGDFLKRQENRSLIQRVSSENHYLGPHSDKHLLYCTWESPSQLLVKRNEFKSDLAANIQKVETLTHSEPGWQMPPPSSWSPDSMPLQNPKPRFFLPPFEHYNQDIANWSAELNCVLINFTPGTRSNADYTGEADTNFVSSQAIFDSILKSEREDPHGLNGFILLLHLGSGPGRQDKFHSRFGELLDVLASKGYQFVRVDELLEPKPEDEQPKAE